MPIFSPSPLKKGIEGRPLKSPLALLFQRGEFYSDGVETTGYKIVPEGAWMQEGEDGLEILSQYDMEKLQFKALDASDDEQQMMPLSRQRKPAVMVHDLLVHLANQAKMGTWVYRDLVESNCRRLIDDSNPLFFHNHKPSEYTQ